MKGASRFLPAALLLTLPFLTSAQVNAGALTPYSNGITDFVNGILVPVLMATAFVVFLWGVYKYFILGAADETSRKDGRQFTLWGIAGFIILVSLWGLLNLIMGTLGLSSATTAPSPPTLKTPL